MKVFELSLKVYLKRDISMEESQMEISKIVDNCLTKDKELLNFHRDNKYKYYSFSSLYILSRRTKCIWLGKYTQ